VDTLTIHLTIVLLLPLAAGLIAAFAPGRTSRWIALVGTLGVLAYWIAMLTDAPTNSAGLQYVTDDMWIKELGIHYALGVDGLNLFLIGLTAILWVAATLASAFREWDRPRLFYFNLCLAETAVLGALLAQDLALFVFFFDLMLVPFYFLIGVWGEYRRVPSTMKVIIFTLAGSLLMLAGAVALGALSASNSGQGISFLFSDLQQRILPDGTQNWIFWLFAIAFLVKMPAFPVHGWMPDGYRAMPLPVLVLFSGVLSKVGAYGFLRIVLPTMPDASAHFQEVMIIIAVVSILYGSVLAFSQDNARLVLGYSSLAQLGFVTLGIFSLDGKGAQGAIMQMVTHGLVVAPLFLIVGLLAARAHGSELLSRMGGIAFRAPVLATLFLIVTLANLAMPGSANFVGELLVLFGAFDTKFVYGLVASAGVVFAAVYMIRMFQQAMHNPVGAEAEAGDIGGRELAVLAPLVLVLLALSIYPQLVLDRTEESTTKQVAPAAAAAGGGGSIKSEAAAVR
jgi:NADH-quinone oxidoreductase subunit M